MWYYYLAGIGVLAGTLIPAIWKAVSFFRDLKRDVDEVRRDVGELKESVERLDKQVSKLIKATETLEVLLKSFYDALGDTFAKGGKEPVTRDDMRELWAKMGKVMQTDLIDKVDELIRSIRSTEKEKRIKELLQKARDGKATKEELEELHKLLNEYYEEARKKEDVAKAALILAAIAFVVALLMALSED